MYFNRYPHCQFANPFCTLAEIPILTYAGILPLAGIPSVQLHIFFLQKQVPFLHRCKNPFSPTARIFSAQLHVSFLQTFSRTLAFLSKESFVFNHRYPFVHLQEFYLSVCRKRIFSIAGYLSVMLYNFFLSFSRNFSFVQLQEYFCKLKGVLSGFVQTTITICFVFILFLFF